MLKFCKAALFMVSLLCISQQAIAEGQYYLAPGRTVIQIPVPEGVTLDEFGCGYIQKNKYKCFAGQFAGSVYTTREDAKAAWRFVVNPPSMYSRNQMRENIKAGRPIQ